MRSGEVGAPVFSTGRPTIILKQSLEHEFCSQIDWQSFKQAGTCWSAPHLSKLQRDGGVKRHSSSSRVCEEKVPRFFLPCYGRYLCRQWTLGDILGKGKSRYISDPPQERFSQEGDRTPVQAAASLCPAYDITRAFRSSLET